MAIRSAPIVNAWLSLSRLCGIVALTLAASGCGLPTWTELTGGAKPEVPAQNPNPPQPVVMPTPVAPPQPKPPTDEEIVAAFQALKSFELDDSSLVNLTKAGEGLAVVEEINLNGSKVTNGGLTHLAKLPNLRHLDVRNSPVDQDGAAAIGALASLESLKLDGGEMTDQAIQALNPLSQLKHLEISNVRLSPGGWAQLTHHTQLESLHVNSSNLSDDTMAIIGEIKSLKVLWLNSVPVTDLGIAHLKGLDNLEKLFVAQTAVTGATFGQIIKGKGLKSLKQLGMDNTQISVMGAKSIMTMTQLEGLGLGNAAYMRDQGFVPMVKPLKNLKDINLSNCKGLTGQAFMAFVGNENIQNINANGCDGIDDSGLKHLLKCTNLKVLDLSGTRCTFAGVQQLKKLMPELDIRGFGPLGAPATGVTDPAVATPAGT